MSLRITNPLTSGTSLKMDDALSVVFTDISKFMDTDPYFFYEPINGSLGIGVTAANVFTTTMAGSITLVGGQATTDYQPINLINFSSLGPSVLNNVGIVSWCKGNGFAGYFPVSVLNSTSVDVTANAEYSSFDIQLIKNGLIGSSLLINTLTGFATFADDISIVISNTNFNHSVLKATQNNSSALQAVTFQGYSDGGFTTKGVLEIKNEIGQRVCLLAGSNQAGAGDYGEMVFLGYADVNFNGTSFGDFNWVNNSGELSGDLRMGTMRVQRDGAANQGTWAVVLRNGASFITAQTQKYSGQLGLKNVTSPTAWLHLPAGTTSASQAPLKFTSGSLQTTAESGAMEFLTDKFYGVITTGVARKEFALADIALTSGRVPFNTTNGRLTDSSAFTFSAGALSVTSITATGLTSGRVPIVGTGGLLQDDSDMTFSVDTLTVTGLKVGTTKITTYNNVAVEGYGVPAIVDHVALTNQGGDIGSTNVTNGGTAGLYRASYYLEETTGDITAGTVTLTISWIDDSGATSVSSASVLLTGASRTSGVQYIQLASGNVSYSTSHTGIFGTSKYALYMTFERVN